MRNSHNFLWNFTTWHHLLSCWLVPSSLWFLYFWAKVTDLLHAAVKEEKISFQAVGFYPKKKKKEAQSKASGWLTTECFAFTSSSTFIPHTLKYPTEVTAGMWQSGGCLLFFLFFSAMLTQGNVTRSFVKLLVLCDQLWLSHWTCLPLKPDPVVRFSLKWKGNTVCLPRA